MTSAATYLLTTSGTSGGGLPDVPTRDQLLDYRLSFQGLKIQTPTYGLVYWWETIAWFPDATDRQAAYAAKRAAGDTHIILDLSGSYKEIGDVYDQIGADYSQNLSALVALAYEVLNEGFYIDLRLAGDGQGSGPGYNDPVGMTYGHDWLMNNLDRIMDAFAPIYRYIIWTPGYDGVFYGWSPEQCMAYAAKIRGRWADAVIGIEHDIGHIPLGEGTGDYSPTGRMKDFDAVFGEFNPNNYHDNNTWGIVSRCIGPAYVPPPDDTPANNGNDRMPRPWYMAQPSARGPFKVIAFEILTYYWVRGQVSDTEAKDCNQYFRNMGCSNVSFPVGL